MRGWFGIVIRVLAGVALVLLTFNPTGHSYYHWALRDFSGFDAIKAVGGTLLLCGWILYARAAVLSLGLVGIVLTALLIASLVWLFATWGLFDPNKPGILTWVALIGVGLLLGIGLSWSILRRGITGQVDVDAMDQ
jgi:hypothetical protein